LSRDERWLLAQALVLLPLTVLGLYLLGVRRWQRALTKLTPLGETRNPNPNQGRSRSTPAVAIADDQSVRERVRVIARIMRITAEHGLYRPNCLQQSLVLWWLLGRNRIASEIRFGARKEDGELKAHAWVECLGFALNEDQDVCRHYSPFEVA
jgi:hypothetical protein